MRPGWISRSVASIRTTSSGAARPGAPTSAMVSPAIRISAGGARWPWMSSTRPLRTMLIRLSAMECSFLKGWSVDAGRPREEDALDRYDNLKQHDPHDRKNDQCAPGKLHLEKCGGGLDQVTEPGIGVDEFGHDSADHSQGNGRLEAAEDEGHGIGQADAPQLSPAVGPAGTAELDQVWWHRHEPRGDRQHEREEGDEKRDDHARQLAGAENDDEDRSQCDLGDCLRQQQQWVDGARDEA